MNNPVFRGEERLSALSFPIVCLSVRTCQLGSHCKDFREISNLIFFYEKPVAKFQIWLKSGKEYWTVYMKTSTFCTSGDNKSQQARRRRVKCYQAVRIAQEV